MPVEGWLPDCVMEADVVCEGETIATVTVLSPNCVIQVKLKTPRELNEQLAAAVPLDAGLGWTRVAQGTPPSHANSGGTGGRPVKLHDAAKLVRTAQPAKEPIPALHKAAGKTRRIALFEASATSNPPVTLSSAMSRGESNIESVAGPPRNPPLLGVPAIFTIVWLLMTQRMLW